jgi:hypothetical protein
MYLTKEQELQITKAAEKQRAMKAKAFGCGLLVASAIWIAIIGLSIALMLLLEICTITNGNI